MGHTVTSKGQVTIPKAVRDMLEIEPGSEVEFALEDGKIVIRKAGERRPLKSRFDAMVGMAGPGPTTNEVMEVFRGFSEPDPGFEGPWDQNESGGAHAPNRKQQK